MGQHLNGEFSMAVVQANNLLEDQSQIESGSLSLLDSGPYGTFVGVYDGHGGPETSRYINDHLFQHLKSNVSPNIPFSINMFTRRLGGTSLVSQINDEFLHCFGCFYLLYENQEFSASGLFL